MEEIQTKITNLENQSYITYLQQNALIKQLSDKGVIDTQLLITDMDELNRKLVQAVNDQEASEGAEAAPEEVVEKIEEEAAV